MRTNESQRKKNSSKSSSFLPPKTSLVPPPVPVSDPTQAFIPRNNSLIQKPVPVTDPTQVFIPRDNSLIQNPNWLIQTSPGPELTMADVDEQIRLRSRLSNSQVSSEAPNSQSVEVQRKVNVGEAADKLLSTSIVIVYVVITMERSMEARSKPS